MDVMDEEVLNKKSNVWKVLKTALESTFKKVGNLMKNHDEKAFKTLRLFQEVLKRKVLTIKILEDEIISIIDNSAEIWQRISGSMKFKTHSKAKLNLFQKHWNISWKLEHYTRTSKRKDTVKLPKLEVPNSMEIQQCGCLLLTHLMQTLNCLALKVASRNSIICVIYWVAMLSMPLLDSVSLVRTNYKKSLDLLKNWYRNPQLIMSAHMSPLVKLSNVESDDLHGLQKYYKDGESNMQSLQNLGIESRSYGSVLSTMII